MKNKEEIMPDFLIIGSMKSGTTTLYSDLRKLSSLYLPSEKEPAILTKFMQKDEIRKEYLNHFKGIGDNQICGEASTEYTKLPMHDGTAKKAYDLCGGKLRLIMIMRDPIERIYSHLRHDIAEGLIKIDEVDKVVLKDAKYIDVSNYAMQLKPWVDTFGSDNLHCVSFIDFKTDRKRVIQDTASFLGVETEGYVFENSISNKSSELRRTSIKMGYVINSMFYRNYIRPILSDKVRGEVRKMLLPKVAVSNVKLSDSVEREVRKKLGDVENEVYMLTGKRIRINAN